mmetsp:Transcript_7189/g.11018  ORF Transcript_7189/g.11018 Transcript_7189/m.11018 type:complete len:207 (-) Transcript_7189:98-718(-)
MGPHGVPTQDKRMGNSWANNRRNNSRWNRTHGGKIVFQWSTIGGWMRHLQRERSSGCVRTAWCCLGDIGHGTRGIGGRGCLWFLDIVFGWWRSLVGWFSELPEQSRPSAIVPLTIEKTEKDRTHRLLENNAHKDFMRLWFERLATMCLEKVLICGPNPSFCFQPFCMNGCGVFFAVVSKPSSEGISKQKKGIHGITFFSFFDPFTL